MAGEQQTGGEGNILAIGSVEQYRTVDELIKKSQPNSVYYTLLLLSTFIITGGILLGNAAIIIGGMLVTPVLTPVLFIALGITIGEPGAIKGAAVLLAKSTGIVIAGGIILSFIFGVPDSSSLLLNNSDNLRAAALYFLVAIAAGTAGTFAWARRDVIDILPGVAIAVSLVPPLALVGIGIGQFDIALARFNLLVYIFNLLGIFGGSFVVFSLLQFYKTKGIVEKKSAEAESAQQQQDVQIR